MDEYKEDVVGIVIGGPGCWLEKKGLILLKDLEKDEIVIQLQDTDDGGIALFEVRMPSICIRETKEHIAKC